MCYARDSDPVGGSSDDRPRYKRAGAGDRISVAARAHLGKRDDGRLHDQLTRLWSTECPDSVDPVRTFLKTHLASLECQMGSCALAPDVRLAAPGALILARHYERGRFRTSGN